MPVLGLFHFVRLVQASSLYFLQSSKSAVKAREYACAPGRIVVGAVALQQVAQFHSGDIVASLLVITPATNGYAIINNKLAYILLMVRMSKPVNRSMSAPVIGNSIPSGSNLKTLYKCGGSRFSVMPAPPDLRFCILSKAIYYRDPYQDSTAFLLVLCV